MTPYQFVICLPNDAQGLGQGACPLGFFEAITGEGSYWVLDTAEADQLNRIFSAGLGTTCDVACMQSLISGGVAAAPPIDYAGLGQIWSWAFISTMLLWLLAKQGGLILSAIRGRNN